MTISPPPHMKFWAKTTPEGQPGIEVFHHCLNVGNVAKILSETKSNMLDLFFPYTSSSSLALIAALHDIGKIAEGFQSKCQSWLNIYNLEEEAIKHNWLEDGRCERKHDLISQFTIYNLLKRLKMNNVSSLMYSIAAGAHHGRPYRSGDKGLQAGVGMEHDSWEEQRQLVTKALIASLGNPPTTELKRNSAAVWWLAGLISISDWIASDERFYDNTVNTEENESLLLAQKAISSLGFDQPKMREDLNFHDIFKLNNDEMKSTPNALQLAAFEVITEPGIYVIEAPMGLGKTEAALWCAYNLITSGKATGLYFALPTQATSNRIHLRVQEFVENICADSERVRLIHANSWLREDLVQPHIGATLSDDEIYADARTGRDWFASAKRALLTSFGVGTVDQALFSVIAVKHFFVRRFALAGKIVIIDEVHSYDVYTGTLITKLCETLESLGCTVILLSATLTSTRRAEYLKNEPILASPGEESYPLITGKRTLGGFIEPCSIVAPANKDINIKFVSQESSLDSAYKAACAGACILWICNTIGKAQQIYQNFLSIRGSAELEIGLLHSRFPHFQRELIEEYWMQRLGKNSTNRKGCILVSTQVVEQSVDLDADLLVTELAPTDMLLQRIGRLWRHVRLNRTLERSECWIISPKETLDSFRCKEANAIIKDLKPNSNVYNPYVLLRTWDAWTALPDHIVKVPSDIRNLLEETYKDRENDPGSWKKLRAEIEGKEFARKNSANTNSLILGKELVNDIEGVAKTRLNEQETVILILIVRQNGRAITLLNEEKVDLSDEDYQIKIARALHRNIVKTPKWVFNDFKITTITSRYLFGDQALALIDTNGKLQIDGIKKGFCLNYSANIGLRIVNSTNEVNDESGV